MLLQNIFTTCPEAAPRVGILHIGAHRCEERPLYAALGMDDSRVVWVDANPSLAPPADSPVRYWIAAVSDTDGAPATFHLTNNSESSSLLTLKTYYCLYGAEYVYGGLVDSKEHRLRHVKPIQFISYNWESDSLKVLIQNKQYAILNRVAGKYFGSGPNGTPVYIFTDRPATCRGR